MATKIVKTLKFPNNTDEFQINAARLGGKTIEDIQTAATQSAAGLMSAEDKKKLDGIASGATANTGDITGVTAGAGLGGGGTSGTVTLTNSGVRSITQDSSDGHKLTINTGGTNTTITIPDNNTTYSNATTSTAGLMSTSDKSKLDGIASGANKTTVDSSLSSSSTNPVQNKVVKAALDGKQATITGAATTIASSNLTASRALVSDSSGKVAVSAVTSTELGYLDGVTSNVQTQLDSKLSKTGGTLTGDLTFYANNTDKAINFKYSDNCANWRIAYLGTGSGDANYLAFQTDKNITDGEMTNALRLSMEKLTATFGGDVRPTTTETQNIGTSDNKWNNVYAKTFNGALSGNASTATKLATARTVRTNLGSTSTASFDGSANITPGVTGTLPVANGGTGATTAAGALTNLGLTATAAELNKMDGVTATTAEINKLDGLTATTTELNYVDGVTSAIQTQLDGKSALEPACRYNVGDTKQYIKVCTITPAAGSNDYNYIKFEIANNSVPFAEVIAKATTNTSGTTTQELLYTGTNLVKGYVYDNGVFEVWVEAVTYSGTTIYPKSHYSRSGKVTWNFELAAALPTDAVSTITATHVNWKGNAATATSATKATQDASGNVITSTYATKTELSGKANSSHGTHVTWSTTTPKANGTAAVGSETKVARGDHVHPLQTTVSGNAGTATKFASAQSVALTGDVTGSASSQAGWSVATTLANSGVTAGSYGPSANASPAHGKTFSVPYITVDAKGRVTSASTKTITLPADNNTTYSVATTSANGLMSSTDKSKLDGIAAGANAYSHPTYTAKSSGLYKVTVDATGHVSAATAVAKADITGLGIPAQDTTYSAATTSAAGLMSAADKTKLNGIATGATANTGTITAVQANGTSVATSGVANIPAASTSAYGVTKLSSSTSSTSTSLAATASAVKAAYDLANGKASTAYVDSAIAAAIGNAMSASY